MQTLYLADYIYHNDAFQKELGLLVTDGMITKVSSKEELVSLYPQASIENWTGKAIVPGTVNAHNHSFQSLLRGIAVDKPFLEWRDQALYKYTPLLDEEAIYTGALFAFGEMVKYGVTTVCDFFYVHNGGTANDEAVIRAAKDVGIRFVMARTMYDWAGAPQSYIESIDDAVARTRKLAIKYQGDSMVDIHPAPHSPHAASPEMIQAGHTLAKELGTPFHIHVAEEMFEVNEILATYKKRPVHYLDSLGVLDSSMIAIHLVWIDESEVTLLGQRGSGLAYCPSSNMFLSDGVTPIPALAGAGVPIALGSDGACSNNRISIFEEMRMCSLLQKVTRLDGTCINAKQVFDMGTKTGAYLLRLNTGELKEGLAADFVSLNLDDLSLSPTNELFANLIYSMQPSAISEVVVDGKLILKKSQLVNIPEKKIVTKVNNLFSKWKKNDF